MKRHFKQWKKEAGAKWEDYFGPSDYWIDYCNWLSKKLDEAEKKIKEMKKVHK